MTTRTNDLPKAPAYSAMGRGEDFLSGLLALLPNPFERAAPRTALPAVELITTKPRAAKPGQGLRDALAGELARKPAPAKRTGAARRPAKSTSKR